MYPLDFVRWQKLLTPAAQDFIAHYLTTPIDRLALLKPKFPDIPFPEILEQIDSLKKVNEKLPDWAGKPHILLPSLAFQQASSFITASYKSKQIAGKTIVDLTGGLGVDSYYFAQADKEVIHVEPNLDLQKTVQHNFQVLDQNQIHYHNQTAEEFLNQDTPIYDAIYIDPARRGKEGQKLIFLEDYSPNILALLPKIFDKTQEVWLKTSPLLDITQASYALGSVQEVHIIAQGQEVKELLFRLKPEVSASATIHAVTLTKNTQEIFSFTQVEEFHALPTYALPQKYIYEPLPAILKAGAFKLFGLRFGLNKLHPHTHLYTSDTLQDTIPARKFLVKAVYPYKKNALKGVLTKPQANILTRNFRDTVAQIRQKLKIEEGGEDYVLGTTLCNQEQALIFAERV